ncbi:MAG TPA: DUF58 domain-containing protein [Candidatus Limnocylindria bacterium]|nr:DUF58 domain-containing protein [Candidatus Limnocylindria bacterium]
MTGRLLSLLAVLVVAAASALSLGAPIFYFIAYTLLLMLVYGLLSSVLSLALTRVWQAADTPRVERGGESALTVSALSRNPLPAGPVLLKLALPDGRAEAALRPGFLRPREARFDLVFPHVGVWPCGATRMYAGDVFGLFRLPRNLPGPLPEIAALPRGYDLAPLKFARMDDGRALPNRSGEDVTSPEDTRAYRQGDPFKRIHWKLSSRSRELIVRRFEIPAPPDTLILMDCTQPEGGEGVPEGALRLRDTLCETALAAAAMQMEGGHPVRVPLYGARVSEFTADKPQGLPLLKEELAWQIFRGGEPFDRVLMLEMRRMRRTGAAVVITTRLDAMVAEGVSNIRRSGPSVRFYLVTFDPGDQRYAPYIARMQRDMTEVLYVTPA